LQHRFDPHYIKVFLPARSAGGIKVNIFTECAIPTFAVRFQKMDHKIRWLTHLAALASIISLRHKLFRDGRLTKSGLLAQIADPMQWSMHTAPEVSFAPDTLTKNIDEGIDRAIGSP
jgi:hypothetical protein